MKNSFILSMTAPRSVGILLSGCKKDDNVIAKISHRDSADVIALMTKNNFDIIDYYTPQDGSNNVNVGEILSCQFSVAIGTPFEVKLAGKTNTYRYNLVSCTLTDQSGTNLVTEYKYNEQDSIITISNSLLNANNQYSFAIKITLSQLIDEEWQPVIYFGTPLEYETSSDFTTGIPAESIRATDILYFYPIDRQLNYMPKESSVGYIMLSYSYRELFEEVAESDLKVIIKNITDETKTDQTTSFTVKECNEVDHEVVGIDYLLKDIMFDPCLIYNLEFNCAEKCVYRIYFRTSQNPNLKTKMADCDWYNGSVIVSGTDPRLKPMTQNVFMNEGFDIFEYPHMGTTKSEEPGNIKRSLIYLTADLDNWAWYQNSIFKSLYTEYTLDYNDDRIVQYPPIDAFSFFNYKVDMYLTDEDIIEKNTKGKSHVGTFPSYIVFYMDEDVWQRRRIINNINNTLVTDLDKEISMYWDAPNYTDGDYPYFMLFRLPGKIL